MGRSKTATERRSQEMVETSRDGKRVYATKPLYGAWDDQFDPDAAGVAVDFCSEQGLRRRFQALSRHIAFTASSTSST